MRRAAPGSVASGTVPSPTNTGAPIRREPQEEEDKAMDLSAVLGVAVGVIGVYLVLSLIVSGIQEILAGVFAWRGTYLAKGIDVILDNRPTAAFRWNGVLDWLKAHFTPRAGKTAAELLRDEAAKQGKAPDENLLRVLNIQRHPLLRSSPSDQPSYVSARNFGLVLLEALRDGSGANPIQEVRKTIGDLPNGDLKETLTALLNESGEDLDCFREGIERWFNDAMDRLSGVYRRFSQYSSLAIGLVLAASLNVDSFRVVSTLWQAPTVRAVLVENVMRIQPPSGGGTLEDALKAVRSNVAQFEAMTLPIGWSGEPIAAASGMRNGSTSRSIWTTWAVAAAIPGWIITALAVSLGAPFWFGLLQKVMNLRNAGPRPKSTTP